MSTDLRVLMRSLAEEAPALDNRIALADEAFSAGRQRRRIRRLEITGATAVVVLCALFATLFVGAKPLAAQYGSSGGTRVSGYPTHIGRQWPVLDLPAKPGPIAGVLISGSTTWAVAASGHRWRIPGDVGGTGYPTAVSPDGRMIAYLSGESGPLVIHDLVSGAITRVPNIGIDGEGGMATYQMMIQSAGPRFSSDDRYLAFDSIYSVTDHVGSVVTVDVAAGRIVATPLDGMGLSGWSGDQLVTYAGPVSVQPITGGTTSTVRLQPTQPLTQSTEGNGRALAVTADGGQFVILTGGDANVQTISRYDLRTGAQIGPQAVVPPASMFCGFSAGRNVVYNHADSSSRTVSVVTVATDGTHRTATTIDPALGPDCGVWASQAYDGNGRGRVLLDRLTGRLISSWVWLAWAAGVATAMGLVRFFGRRRAPARAARNAAYPQFARQPWTRRRKRAVLLLLAAPLLALLALLTPFVFLPLAAPELGSSQPVIWWSVHDQAAAKAGAVNGYPATVLTVDAMLDHGYAVLVENHGNIGVTISDADPSSSVPVTVATSSGTAAQARSLSYRLSAAIPPHQARWVHVRWSTCPPRGGTSGNDQVGLRVKIGWITRTESVTLTPLVGFVGADGPGAAC